jgi:exonuclease SbcC
MTARYQRVCDRLMAPPPVISVPEPIAEDVTVTVTEPVDIPATRIVEVSEANPSLAQIATDICIYAAENTDHPNIARVNKLKKQLEKAWTHCSPPHPDDVVCWNEANTTLHEMESMLELQSQRSQKELEKGQALLTQMETELEQGELHKALETRARLLQFTREHGKSRDWQQINNRMSAMQVRLRELRDWLHWSNNKIRKRLIAEMEVLPSADLHPDALVDRVKSLQAEWKTLEQSEQIPGDKKFVAAAWMWRKFNAAGKVAFDTAKPYLDKRSEIQVRHAQSLATFCAELNQLAQTEPPDWTALGKAITRGRKKLHDLNSVPASQRQ